jgi:hypothetical protein
VNPRSTTQRGYSEALPPCTNPFYLRFCSQFYKQTESMAMGPALSLVTASFTEDSEEVALDWVTHKGLMLVPLHR